MEAMGGWTHSSGGGSGFQLDSIYDDGNPGTVFIPTVSRQLSFPVASHAQISRPTCLPPPPSPYSPFIHPLPALNGRFSLFPRSYQQREDSGRSISRNESRERHAREHGTS